MPMMTTIMMTMMDDDNTDDDDDDDGDDDDGDDDDDDDDDNGSNDSQICTKNTRIDQTFHISIIPVPQNRTFSAKHATYPIPRKPQQLLHARARTLTLCALEPACTGLREVYGVAEAYTEYAYYSGVAAF